MNCYDEKELTLPVAMMTVICANGKSLDVIWQLLLFGQLNQCSSNQNGVQTDGRMKSMNKDHQ